MQRFIHKTKTMLFLKAIVLSTCFLLMGATNASAQEGTEITGTVIEASSQTPLPGVSVVLKGKTIGTITDLDGKFTLKAAASDVLVFSFIGYASEEVTVGNQSTIDISLAEDITGLDEVVVMGYGVQKKSDLTGSVASVSSEKLTEMPALGVDDALQGRASGVSVISNSGKPGSSSTIQIRGISSINGSEPLVIVDGVRASLSGLNPSDIESMEILKDASSAAIYGSAGGNGVILITTKKGKAGKTRVNFDYYVGNQKPSKYLDIMDGQEYAEAMNLIGALRGRGAGYFTTMPDTMPTYDWQREMMQSALQQNYNLSVSGGNENSNYFLSANYQDQDGIVQPSDYSKLGFRLNSEHKINKYLKVGENAQFTQSKTSGYEEWQFQNSYNNPIQDIYTMEPYLQPYDADGNWVVSPSDYKNPAMSRDIMNKDNITQSSGGNVYLDFTPIKGLVITSKANGWTNYTTRNAFYPEYYYSATTQNETNSVYKKVEHSQGWQVQNYANYNTTLAEVHNLGVMIGMEAGKSTYEDIEGERNDLINETEEMQYLSASTDQESVSQFVTGKAYEDAAFAYFGRINYDYKSKYLLTANLRQDYSSRFGPDHRSGVFPSFSLGWKFSEESFMANLPFISFGKIRYGWGQNGANAPQRYAYYSSVLSTNTSFDYVFDGSTNAAQGAVLKQIPNTEMHWETMIMSNLGLDLNFFDDQISFSADWFSKESDGMLMAQELPATVGVYQGTSSQQLGGEANPITNIGKFKNSGIELSLGFKDAKHAVKSSIDFNFTYVKNEVGYIQGDSIYKGEVGPNLRDMCLTAEGAPVSQLYGYETNGLFSAADAEMIDGELVVTNQPYWTDDDGVKHYAQDKAQPGDLIFVDQNGDGKINSKDKVNMGNTVPKYIFGLSANFEYKGFDLNIFLESKLGFNIFNGTKYWGMSNRAGGNRLTDVLDQYYEDIYDNEGNLIYAGNTDTDLPRLDPAGDNNNYTTVSDIFVESGNYLRVKNLQLGYTLPKNLVSKVNIEKIRLYVGVKNLLTLTNYSGNDPEIAPIDRNPLIQGVETGGTYARPRMFLFGINAKF